MHPAWVSPFSYAAFSGQGFLAALFAASGDETRTAFAPGSALWSSLVEAQTDYQTQYVALWHGALSRSQGRKIAPVIEPEQGDRRFNGAAWRDNPYFDFLKQNYLLQSRALHRFVDALDIDEAVRQRLRFCARQLTDALSPTNFVATNPDALNVAAMTQGESLLRGMQNLHADLARGKLSITDEAAFAVGVNLATTPGSVIYENDVMQLIQYASITDSVRARPLVIVPPCINKYYVLDLSPHNSFVRYAVEQGNTVFMISWRNIEADGRHLTWDDYIERGVLKAIEIARAVREADEVNTLGYCVGGTMLGTALTVLAARGEQHVGSATLVATMLDFSDTGEIGMFVDEATVSGFEAALAQGGVRAGRDLAAVFAAVRGNDVIWPYVVNNYLLGKAPAAFDILYWNEDYADLPGPWYCWYLRHTYLENNLRRPNAVAVCGQPLDLGRVTIPGYVLATREDHIVPWQTAYRSMQLLDGERRFVLAASGHVAGILNPPAHNRRSYWSSDTVHEAPDAWFAAAAEHAGSWWIDWDAWLARHAGGSVPAPERVGSAQYGAIEDAPGRYVKQRAH